MHSHGYYVYILTNRSGTLYTGVTNSLYYRVRQHRSGKCAFTAKYRIGKLIYAELCPDAYSAIVREKQMKGWSRDKKLALIRTLDPAFRDLAPELDIARPFLFPGRRRIGYARLCATTGPSFLWMTGVSISRATLTAIPSSYILLTCGSPSIRTCSSRR
jgi:putative endonuclease